jgi:hypothetical protein
MIHRDSEVGIYNQYTSPSGRPYAQDRLFEEGIMPSAAVESVNRTEPTDLWLDIHPALEDILSSARDRIVEQVRSLLAHNRPSVAERLKSEELVRACMPRILPDVQDPDESGLQFWWRLATDHAREKDILGQYAAQEYVRDGLRCFVQASTSALYFGKHIAKLHKQKSTLFYTNSIYFPMTVLSQSNFHSVFSFCGPIYDAMCGGWLFEMGDQETQDQLRLLFRRPKDKLTTVFLMPLAIKGGQIYFPRRETALLASILIDEAEHVIILSPAARVYGPDQALKTEHHVQSPTRDLRNKQPTLVVCGNADERESTLQAVRDSGFQVKWLPCPTEPPAANGAERVRGLLGPGDEAADPEAREFHEQFDASPSGNGRDERWLRDLFDRIADILRGGPAHAASEATTLVHDVCELSDVLRAFRSAPNKSIAGAGGVAEQLKISRNALYVRLRDLGLKSQDFFADGATLYTLIQRSPELKAKADRVLRRPPA